MTPTSPRFRRDYDGAKAALRARLDGVEPLGADDREARMQLVVDVLWERLGADGEGHADGRGVAWVGFYLPVFDAGKPVEMVLGPRRDKPACSPVALYGACGRAFLTGTALVVTDIAKLGENYVACDPRDRSELVVPLLDQEGGGCWGVLDFDSYAPHAFSADEVPQIELLLLAAGLPSGASAAVQLI